MKFSVLGACSGLGQKLDGLDSAPDLIRENGFLQILKIAKTNFTDLGNLQPATTNDIWPFLNQLKDKVSQHISKDHLIFNLGGDHSIAIGTVSGTLEKYPDARVIWIDAHGDINTPSSSLTGNLHGMPLAALLGLFKTNLKAPPLKKENLILIGIRDLDHFEDELIQSLGLTIITAQEIADDPVLAVKKIKDWIKLSDTPLHLSFDIDSVDPKIAPATGLKVPDGLKREFVQSLIQHIAATKNVLAIDLVEFNPLQANNKTEIDSTLEIFFNILQIFIDAHCSKETLAAEVFPI